MLACPALSCGMCCAVLYCVVLCCAVLSRRVLSCLFVYVVAHVFLACVSVYCYCASAVFPSCFSVYCCCLICRFLERQRGIGVKHGTVIHARERYRYSHGGICHGGVFSLCHGGDFSLGFLDCLRRRCILSLPVVSCEVLFCPCG